MKNRSVVQHLDDMIEYGERALSYVGEFGLAELTADRMRADAVARVVEVMGEACKRVPDGIKDRFPALPWKPIARMRDKLIHHYDGVDWEVVWETVTRFVPSALVELRTIRDVLRAEEPPPPEVPPDA